MGSASRCPGIGWRLLLAAAAVGALSVPHAEAQVVRDGSIGPGVEVQPVGPHYEIPASMGEQAGGNLFHSFGEFSLHTIAGVGESATFTPEGASGPIDNVVSRVTGGSPSEIDGVLRSTIPEADFYFLNPAGFLFGQKAALDVQGSLNVSTARSLGFHAAEAFEASPVDEVPMLAVASPSDFGFLGNATRISVSGSLLENRGGIALSAAAIQIHGASTIRTEAVDDATGGDISIRASESIAVLGTEGGGRPALITEASPNSKGRAGSIQLKAPRVRIADGTLISRTSGLGGPGDIFIRADESFTYSSRGNAFIQVRNTGSGVMGSIRIEGGVILLEDRAELRSDTVIQGGASGPIDIIATESFTMTGAGPFLGPQIFALTRESDGAPVRIQAPRVRLEGGANVLSSTLGSGSAGDISIFASQSATFTGIRIDAASVGRGTTGDGGSIHLEAPAVSIGDGTLVTTRADGAGSAGSISVVANESLSLLGRSPSGEPSSLVADGRNGGAGVVRVEAPSLELRDGALIRSNTSGTASGGNIEMDVGRLSMADGSSIAATSRGIAGALGSPGDAGEIVVGPRGARHPTRTIALERGSSISTEAEGADGGDIELRAEEQVRLVGGDVSANVGDGVGGNIDISSRMVILRDSRVVAQAGAGRGGAIRITGDFFVADQASLVSASASDPTLSGTVEIQAPDTDLAAEITKLPASFLDASVLLRERCAAGGDSRGSFVERASPGLPPGPDGILPALGVAIETAGTGLADLPPRPAVAWVAGGCADGS